MPDLAIWHGSLEQSYQLEACIQHNCACERGPANCGAHRAMLDQRFIDGILFVRSLREQLLREEGLTHARSVRYRRGDPVHH